MKLLIACLLLTLVSLTFASPAHARQASQSNEKTRAYRKAFKKSQKYGAKYAKQQRKAMRKSAKAQRKALKKSQRAKVR